MSGNEQAGDSQRFPIDPQTEKLAASLDRLGLWTEEEKLFQESINPNARYTKFDIRIKKQQARTTVLKRMFDSLEWKPAISEAVNDLLKSSNDKTSQKDTLNNGFYDPSTPDGEYIIIEYNDNNQIVFRDKNGDPIPLDKDGNPVAQPEGMTNRKRIGTYQLHESCVIALVDAVKLREEKGGRQLPQETLRRYNELLFDNKNGIDETSGAKATLQKVASLTKIIQSAADYKGYRKARQIEAEKRSGAVKIEPNQNQLNNLVSPEQFPKLQAANVQVGASSPTNTPTVKPAAPAEKATGNAVANNGSVNR